MKSPIQDYRDRKKMVSELDVGKRRQYYSKAFRVQMAIIVAAILAVILAAIFHLVILLSVPFLMAVGGLLYMRRVEKNLGLK